MKPSIRIFIALVVALAKINAQTVELALPETTTVRGLQLNAAVTVGSTLTGSEVTAFQLQVRFNPDVMSFDSVIVAGTMAQAAGMSVTSRKPANNLINVAAAGTTPLAGAGALIRLRFTLHHSGYSELTFTDAAHNFLNEGTPAVTLNNGYVSIQNPPALYLYPNDVLLSVGEQVQMNVYGGAAPFRWSVTDSAVAGIDTLGKLTALAPGFTRVAVSNLDGLVDTIDSPVEVRASKLFVRDTSVYSGQAFDLPVYSSSLSGLNYSAAHVVLTYNPEVLSALSIVTTGTMLQGRAAPTVNFSKAGTVDVAWADASALSGSGVLFFIRFQAKSGGYSNISFTDALFNQGAKVKTVNASVNTQALSTLYVNPQNANIVVGDSLQFTVSTPTGAVQWSTSDSTVASINQGGKIVALKSGAVKVKAQDALNAVGYSDLIRVFDARVAIGEVYAQQAGVVQVPVLVKRFNPASSASSFQMTAEFDTSAMDFQSLVVNGTLTISWSQSVSLAGTKLFIAGASASAVQSTGTLLLLQFKMRTTPAPVSSRMVYLRQFMFNEGTPTAIAQDGSVTVVDVPQMPYLIQPSDNATGLTSTVEFQWSSVSYFERYHVQVATDTGFTQIAYGDSNRTTTNWMINGLNPSTAYYWRVRALNVAGSSSWTGRNKFTTGVFVGVKDPSDIPATFELRQNYPNPFNPTTTFEFRISDFGFVSLKVFDVLGRKVTTLENEELSAGQHRAAWNAAGMPSGIYLARMVVGGKEQIRKMLLLK